MDLKGSLEDTNLKIYPTPKLIEFLQSIDGSQVLDIPENIEKFISFPNKKKKSHSTKITPDIHLNNEEVEHLNKLRQHFMGRETENGIDKCEREQYPDFHTNYVNTCDTENEESEKESDSSLDGNDQSKVSDQDTDQISDTQKDKKSKLNQQKKPEKPFLLTSDIDWLYSYLHKKIKNGEKDVPFLHVLLENCLIILPKNKLIKRNPELEARCVKLRAQQEAREYRKMTKGVDNVRIRYPEDSIAFQLKSMNRQLIAIGQFIISIFAGFLFGFRGVEWMVGNLDFGFRLLLGVMCALIIALAEIYFLAKKLNEELQMTETIQIGGPPKFADPPLRKFKDPKEIEKVLKEHED